jgi:hypothetical protein
MSDSDLTINCWILGDKSEHIFPVKISRNENVAVLKDAIKTKKLITLNDVDAVTLIQYNVSIPYSPQLAEHAAALELDKLEINPFDKLSQVFADGLLRTDVHVVVEVPQGMGRPTLIQHGGECFIRLFAPSQHF